LSNVANAKQGNSTNNKWYDYFNTKVEVAESVSVSFDFKKIWEYCALEAHKAAYTSLRPDEQEAVRVSALRVVRRRRRLVTRKRKPKPPRILRTLIRSGGRTRSATDAARRDILPQRAQSNHSAIMKIS
jgi:hypothetical protein